MCGLTAFLTVQQDSGEPVLPSDENLEEALDNSLDTVQHRGPDARGQWISPDRLVGERFCPLPVKAAD